MKHYFYHYLGLLLCGLFVLNACSKKEEEYQDSFPEETTEGFIISATYGNGSSPQSRLIHTPDGEGMKLGWSNDDSFELVNQSGNAITCSIIPETINNVDGTADFLVSGKLNAVDTYTPHYPKDYSDTVMDLTGQEQSINNSTAHLSDCNYMKGASFTLKSADEKPTISFANEIAILGFAIEIPNIAADELLQSLTFRTNCNAALAEDNKGLRVKNIGAANEQYAAEITLGLTGYTAGTKSFDAYLALLPSTVQDYIECQVTTDKGNYYWRNDGISSGGYKKGEMYNGVLELEKRSSEFTSATPTDTDTMYGGGTEKYPYLISNAAELAFVREKLNLGALNYKKQHYKLTTDIEIDTGENSWIPIGIVGRPFEATFDGNNHIISGTMESTTNNPDFGFFGRGKDCTIQNLHVNATVIGEYNSSACHVGGIIGYLLDGAKIDRCTFDGSVSSSSNYNSYSGGIVGYGKGGDISKCKNSGKVSSAASSQGYSGGIVGGFEGITENFTGNITANADIRVSAGSILRTTGAFIGIAAKTFSLLGSNEKQEGIEFTMEDIGDQY